MSEVGMICSRRFFGRGFLKHLIRTVLLEAHCQSVQPVLLRTTLISSADTTKEW